MSLNDVRRQPRSSVRANSAADRAAPSGSGGDHRVGTSSVDRSTLIRPGADAATSRSRVTIARSLGVDDPRGATVPSSARANSSRDSAESRLSRDPAHHSTAWCRARVSAT
jgi:hypothetical protein